MIESNKPIVACYVDNIGGLGLPQAVKLAKHFDKMYYVPGVYQNPFPLIAPTLPGIGYKELEVIRDPFSNINDIDVYIIGDIYLKSIGEHLRSLGKLVWGGGESEEIETDRQGFYLLLEKLNMNNSGYKVIKGIQKLKAYLQDRQNLYIKLSYWRGQAETFKWINQAHNGVLLDQMEYTLGPAGSEVEFVVQSPITSDVETGCDTYAVNGVLPLTINIGIEIKNSCYLGGKTLALNAPKPVSETNERFSLALKTFQHTGFYSTEIRYNTKTNESYYIDPCMRLASPGSVYIDMISNWRDIIVEGAKGILVEPEYRYKYGCEIILKSSWVKNNFLPVVFPKEYKSNVNLKGSFIKDGNYFIIPFNTCGFELEEFGSVVVVGNDYTEIMKEALEIASSVEGYDVRYEETALDKALEQIQILEDKIGYKF